MATFLNDTFTEANGVLLTSHAGEAGATWTKHSGYSGVATCEANRFYCSSSPVDYDSSGTPASPDYDVTATITIVSTGVSCEAGVIGRAAAGANTDYVAYLDRISAGSAMRARLGKRVAGSFTSLGSAFTITPTAGTDHTVTLRMVGDQISCLYDGSTVVGPITDTAITAAGVAGVHFSGVVATSTGFHIADVSAADPVVPPAPTPQSPLIIPHPFVGPMALRNKLRSLATRVRSFVVVPVGMSDSDPTMVAVGLTAGGVVGAVAGAPTAIMVGSAGFPYEFPFALQSLSADGDVFAAFAPAPFRIPNRNVGPMALRNKFRRALPPDATAAAAAANVIGTPGAASLTLTGSAPSLDAGIVPSGGTLALTGSAPVIDAGIRPSGASLTVTGAAPTVTVSNNVTVTPTAASLTVTGAAPNLDSGIRPSGASLTLTGAAPSLDAGVRPGTAILTLTGSAPQLNSGIIAAAATLTVTGSTPDVVLPVTPDAAPLTVTGGTPDVLLSSTDQPVYWPIRIPNRNVGPMALRNTFRWSILLPSEDAQPVIVTPAAASLTLTSGAPQLDSGIRPAAAALTVIGSAPQLDSTVRPSAASLTVTSAAPRLDSAIRPAAASITLTGLIPQLDSGIGLTAGSLTLTGAAPTVDISAPAVFYAPLQIPNPFVGPMALRNKLHRASSSAPPTVIVSIPTPRTKVTVLSGKRASQIGMAVAKPGAVTLSGRRDSTTAMTGSQPDMALAGTYRTESDL